MCIIALQFSSCAVFLRFYCHLTVYSSFRGPGGYRNAQFGRHSVTSGARVCPPAHRPYLIIPAQLGCSHAPPLSSMLHNKLIYRKLGSHRPYVLKKSGIRGRLEKFQSQPKNPHCNGGDIDIITFVTSYPLPPLSSPTNQTPTCCICAWAERVVRFFGSC